jgi:N-methylhydantoinase A/oxoprolinase/acetone carboxylase beta subunit
MMDWGLSIVASEDDTLAYYWRDEKATLVNFSSENSVEDLESALLIITENMGMNEIRRLFSGDGMVRLATSHSIDLIRRRKGNKTGIILSEDGLESLPNHEKTYLPLSNESVAFIGGGVNEKGKHDKEMEAQEVIKAYRDLLKVGVHSVVLSLKNSWMFPDRERRVRDILKENYPSRYLGGVPVYVSSDFEIDYRNSGVKILTFLNAYVQASLRKYCFDLEQKLRALGYKGGLFVANRYGGLSRWDKTTAIDTAESVLGASLAGAEALANKYHMKNALVFHVDAYSTSFGLVQDGTMGTFPTGKVLGATLNGPSAEALSIPVGLRSRVQLDSGRISFNNSGGEDLTLEDLEGILGYRVDPLDKTKLLRFQQSVAEPLQKSVEDAALEVRRAFVSHVSQEASSALSSSGIDVAGYHLLPSNAVAGAYGWELGKALGISRVFMLHSFDYLGAFGLCSMGLRHRWHRSAAVDVGSDFHIKDKGQFLKTVREGMHRLEVDAASEGFPDVNLGVTLKMISQVNGQDFLEFVTPMEAVDDVSLDAAIEAYCKDLKTRFKERSGSPQIRLAGIEMTASLPLDGSLPSPVVPEEKGTSEVKKAEAWWDDLGIVETPFCPHNKLKRGDKMRGPAILEGSLGYYVLPPNAEMEVTEDLNGIVEVN